MYMYKYMIIKNAYMMINNFLHMDMANNLVHILIEIFHYKVYNKFLISYFLYS